MVTKGQRIVLVGFVEVDEWNVMDGVLGEATKQWGRNHVCTFFNKRRLELLKQQQPQGKQQPTWRIKNWRYLPKDTPQRRLQMNEGRSYFGPQSVVPFQIMENISNRADLERIRKKRLKTEDALLRGMLLPREERGEKHDVEEGESKEVTNLDLNGLDF